jgi:hypothetical protein
VVFSIALSLSSIGGSLSSGFHLPTVELANAIAEPCQTNGSGGACSQFWYPAGPAMDSLRDIIYTDSTAELTDLQSSSPSIDFPDSPLSPNIIPTLSSSPNFLVSAPISETGYYEIQFMMANNFWGCSFNFGNSTCGAQIRQGIAHMIDKTSFTKNDPSIAGLSTPIDNPVPTSSLGGLTSPNPCNYDTSFPQTGSQCITGAAGGTSYHLANSTGADGFPWLQTPGSLDLNAAAQHFVNAGLATGFNSSTSVLTGVSSVAASHPVSFFIRNDDPPRLDLGQGLEAQICYIFTGSYTVPCPYLSVTFGPITAFPGFTTSATSVNLSWGMYTAAFGNIPTFDSSLYFNYNSQLVSGISSIKSPNGPCSSQSQPSNSASDYIYLCSPTYDSLSSQMELSSSLSQAVSFGLQAESNFGANTFTLPMFERTVQFGYPNTGWTRVINDNNVGLPNYFTWLNAWNPSPPEAGTIRQGFSQTTNSVNPFLDSTSQDSYIINNVYDTLAKPNPLSPSQLIEWMIVSLQQLPNSGLTYTPPFQTTQTYRITLRPDLFFQDGRAVTAFDVALSYLSLLNCGCGFAGVLTPLTGITVLGPRQLDINALNFGPFTMSTLTSVPILPGSYWTNAGSVAWNNAIATCTVNNALCYPAQYTINPTIEGVNCALICTFSAADISINVAQTGASFDPIAHHILIGSGPWQCGTGSTLGYGCSSSGFQNPPAGGSYSLTRFGKGLAPASSVSGIYFRSSGDLALCIWATGCGHSAQENNFLLFAQVAACFGQPVNLTSPCGHWQQGIGNPGTGNIVGLSQVSIVNRFTGVNWLDPYDWQSSPPLGVGTFPPVLYEGPITLNPSTVAGCPTGYDC